MNKEIEKLNFSIGLNAETAEWVNGQHERLGKGTKLLLDIALSIGKVLAGVEKSHNDTFPEWLKNNVSFSKMTAYRYISIFNYRNQIAGAENLTEAYKLIETLQVQKKQSETQKAYQRVAEYRKTGIKPEGWRQHTDDKLAKEEADRDTRIEAVKRGALEKEAAHEAEEQRRRKEDTERMERIEKLKRETEELQKESRGTKGLMGLLAEQAEAEKKRAAFKEKIRLSADGAKDPFHDVLMDYLYGIADVNRRIEACHNIIKICKAITNELQGKA